jgi:nucleoside 2-deoxyribosyltransferase
MQAFPETVRRAVSWYTREKTEAGAQPTELTTTTFDEIARSYGELSVLEKLDRLLQALASRSKHLGDEVEAPSSEFWAPLVRANSSEEVDYLITHLIKTGLLYSGPVGLVLTVPGWERVDRHRGHVGRSSNVFVAMWFDPALDSIYELGIAVAVRECGLTPVRVDRVPHNDKIDDRIIAEIRKCGLLIADFTGHRQGVYFEAGFAMGLGKPVIWLCRDEDIAEAHFDTRQYNHVVWSRHDDLKVKLQDRLNATVLASGR